MYSTQYCISHVFNPSAYEKSGSSRHRYRNGKSHLYAIAGSAHEREKESEKKWFKSSFYKLIAIVCHHMEHHSLAWPLALTDITRHERVHSAQCTHTLICNYLCSVYIMLLFSNHWIFSLFFVAAVVAWYNLFTAQLYPSLLWRWTGRHWVEFHNFVGNSTRGKYILCFPLFFSENYSFKSAFFNSSHRQQLVKQHAIVEARDCRVANCFELLSTPHATGLQLTVSIVKSLLVYYCLFPFVPLMIPRAIDKSDWNWIVQRENFCYKLKWSFDDEFGKMNVPGKIALKVLRVYRVCCDVTRWWRKLNCASNLFEYLSSCPSQMPAVSLMSAFLFLKWEFENFQYTNGNYLALLCTLFSTSPAPHYIIYRDPTDRICVHISAIIAK